LLGHSRTSFQYARPSVHTLANQFGEFSGEIDNSGDLQMTFASPGGTPIVISLREALGHLPEEIA